MVLKVYADRMSQPSRAILIFCKENGIDFEEIRVDLGKRQHLLPEFKAINPLGQVPAITDGRFKLFESWGLAKLHVAYRKSNAAGVKVKNNNHAILIYLTCAFPGVADHWYPNDLSKRSKIHSVLDWHHSNLRRGAAPFVLHTILGPALGISMNPQAAAEAEKVLTSSLSKLESVWLSGKGKFLLGSFQPSIADLSLVCEIMQLELLHDKDRIRILSPFKKVLKWIEDTRTATSPHFEEVHKILFRAKSKFHKLPIEANYESMSSMKAMLPSKL